MKLREERESHPMNKILACAVLVIAQSTYAKVVINITESNGNVDLELSGSINTDALGSFAGTFASFNGYRASDGNIALSGPGAGTVETYNTGISWTPFGDGAFGLWDTASGDAFAMFSNPSIGLPVGYISGSTLFATARMNGDTLASMGFDLGSFVTVITNGNNTDTVTVNINTIPAPGTFAMVGLGGLVVARRRR
jgi:hypothetical protein